MRLTVALACILSALAGPAAGDPLPPGATLRLGSARLRHASSIAHLAASADGKRLASAADDGIRIWSIPDGAPVAWIPGGRTVVGTPVIAIALSPDGARLTTLRYDNLVETYDVASGKLLSKRAIPHTAGLAGALSPDGALAALAFDDDTARLLDATGERVKVAATYVKALAISPDGRSLAIGTGDGHVQVGGAVSWNEAAHTAEVQALTFSPDGRRVASVADDKRAEVRDAATGKLVFSVDLEHAPGYSVAFQGSRLLVGSMESIEVFEAATGKALPVLDADRYAGVFAFAVSDTWWASGGGDDSVHLWPDTAVHGDGARWHIWRLAWAKDGRIIAGDAAGGTLIWDDLAAPPRRILADVTPHALAVTRDASLAAIASDALDFVHLPDGAVVAHLERPVNDLAFSPDGATLAVGEGDRLTLLDVATHAVKNELHFTPVPHRHLLEIASLAWTPDGQRVVCGLDDGSLRVVDAARGVEVGRALLPDPPRGDNDTDSDVAAIALSPDGKSMAAVTKGGLVRVWLTAAPQRPARVLGPVNTYLNAVTFSPDGRLLATAGGDGVVTVFGAGRQPVARFAGHVGFVNTLAFSPDGKRLASAGCDSSVLVWDVSGLR